MAQIRAACLSKPRQHSFVSGLTNFLKCVAVNRAMNWKTGCRRSAKLNPIGEFSESKFGQESTCRLIGLLNHIDLQNVHERLNLSHA